MKSGRLAWEPVNVDEPANRYYVDAYQLYSKAVVLSVARNGTEKRWKNLERVWTLVQNEAAFKNYVRAGIRKELDTP